MHEEEDDESYRQEISKGVFGSDLEDGVEDVEVGVEDDLEIEG